MRRSGAGVLTSRHRNLVLSAAVAMTAVAGSGHSASAATATATWTGAGSDFEGTANWTGGTGSTGTGSTGTVTPVAPVPKNSADTTGTSGDVATFSTDPASVSNPNVTATRSVQGLLFSTATGGWTLSGNAGTVLTVGGNGVSTAGQTGGTDTVSANVNLSQTSAVVAGAGGTLAVTGALASGTAATPAATVTTFGSSTATGTVVLNPTSGTDAFYTNVSARPSATVTGGTLQLGVAGSTAAGVSGVFSNSTTGTPVGGLATGGTNTGRILVAGGTWQANDVGANDPSYSTGTLEVSGGTLSAGGGRYIANFSATGGGRVVVDGGTFAITGNGGTITNDNSLQIGATAATAAAGFTTGRTVSLDVTSGTLDVARTAAANQIGNVGSTNAFVNQDGGTVRFGINGATNVFTGAAVTTNTNANLNIGSGKAAGRAAYTMTGGRLILAGTLQGTAPATGVTDAINNFNFMGGQLTAAGINTTNLSSSPTATFTGSGLASVGTNQAATGSNAGVFENYGGTLAPGDVGVSGRTLLTGNYAGNGGNATLAFDVGGTAQATTFQSGTYDLLAVTGTVALNDKLVVSLINGFTPTNDTAVTILTSTGLTGAFSNVAFGGTGMTADGLYSFAVGQSGNNVTLSNFAAVPEPAGLAVLGVLAFAARRRRSGPASGQNA